MGSQSFETSDVVLYIVILSGAKLKKIVGGVHRGGARNFPTGADSSDKGAKIRLSGYCKCQKSPTK